MHYEYREVGFKGKIIKFIKPVRFNSDGLVTAPIDELLKVADHIEATEPDTIVIVMLGRSDTSFKQGQDELGQIMKEFWQGYRRQPDEYYHWDSAEA